MRMSADLVSYTYLCSFISSISLHSSVFSSCPTRISPHIAFSWYSSNHPLVYLIITHYLTCHFYHTNHLDIHQNLQCTLRNRNDIPKHHHVHNHHKQIFLSLPFTVPFWTVRTHAVVILLQVHLYAARLQES